VESLFTLRRHLSDLDNRTLSGRLDLGDGLITNLAASYIATPDVTL